MYLNLLNKDEQQNFLELARYSMGVNGEHKKEEEEILLGYKFECQLIEYKANRQDEIEKIIKILGASSKKVKKIILIEILGIFQADGEICNKETEFLNKLSQEFNIEEYEVKRIKRWVEAMKDIVQEGYELISK
ncbi:hypothetical protein CJ671_09075 [Aliarcobacter cryaerophilus]|uniref:Co-chaperone DjlA N-terminal domain-containing protein n=1 Tax=Aliarcobacter cryaerophilus TaxID=28198 RepID=A0A2S9SNX6_9BACT|nr:hypothetical protein [Aliarcobacter cryaerophilus]PRM88280.1 hypothetical protein CJ671_09075 [Aliarcobacter cryaerophilus]